MNAEVLRPGHGVRLKLAKEFVGFTDTDKKFRELAREAIGDQLIVPGSGAYKTYKAHEIRMIRQKLMAQAIGGTQPALPPVVNFRMSKGGTGKTTCSSNIGTCLAQFGHRVLIIDGDPQGSLSKQLGFDINQQLTHVGALLERVAKRKPIDIQEAVVPVYPNGMLDLIPADITLANDSWMINAVGRESLFLRLMEAEASFFKRYDVVIIDSAPGTSLLTTVFMAASNIITAVVLPEPQSVLALEVLEANIEEINESVRRNGPRLGLHIIANRYRQTYKSHNEALERLGSKYAPYLNDTIIRDYAGFLRETDMDDYTKSVPVLESEPNSVGARDIIDVTKAIVKLYNIKISPTSEATAP